MGISSGDSWQRWKEFRRPGLRGHSTVWVISSQSKSVGKGLFEHCPWIANRMMRCCGMLLLPTGSQAEAGTSHTSGTLVVSQLFTAETQTGEPKGSHGCI